MDDLVYKVIEWGREHKINNPVMQALKVNEEVGEIATEITHDRLHGPDMIDAIGDSLVTIIILADIFDVFVSANTKKGHKAKQYPRPKQKRKIGSGAIPISEFWDWWNGGDD